MIKQLINPGCGMAAAALIAMGRSYDSMGSGCAGFIDDPRPLVRRKLPLQLGSWNEMPDLFANAVRQESGERQAAI
jgi:hypothetical protein